MKYKVDVDESLEKVMSASGSSLKHFMPHTMGAMRSAMIDVMKSSYIDGANAAHQAMKSESGSRSWDEAQKITESDYRE